MDSMGVALPWMGRWPGLRLLGAVAAGALVVGLVEAAPLPLPVRSGRPVSAIADLAAYVNPLIGTSQAGLPDGGGNVFVGADVPFGMLSWGPHTNQGFAQGAGYDYANSMIEGFGMGHFSGRAFFCQADFPVMPTVGPLASSPGVNWAGYSSPFSHTNEVATPAYYAVNLARFGIETELSATMHTGLARFTFPPSTAATVLVSASGFPGHASLASVNITGPTTLTAAATTTQCGGAAGYHVYLAAQFDRPFTARGTWSGGTVSSGAATALGAQTGAYLSFDTTSQQTVEMHVALSYVSTANAQANLAAEAATWDMTATRAAAEAAWNAQLGKVAVGGGSLDERTILYTALYHAMLNPSVLSDANGQYTGFDGQVHTMPPGRAYYGNISSWDGYRNQMKLLAVLAPDVTSDIAESLVLDAEQDGVARPNGGGLARWIMVGGGSNSMDGDGQDVNLATALGYGASKFDTAAALSIMDRGAGTPGVTASGVPVRVGLSNLLGLGYVPVPIDNSSASLTEEYAIDDFAISQFARQVGSSTLEAHYLARAQEWKNVWDASATSTGATGWIVPRNPDGSFVANFSATSGSQFREGDSATYTWMVPFDYAGLISRMGGAAAAVSRLDNHFTQLNAGLTSQFAYMGNEPESVSPWVYDFAGAPYRTQDVVRRIELQLFSNTPTGIPGNDDGGATSSWLAFAMIGLFPEIPGVAGFVIGSPLFTSVTLHLAGGDVQIDAPAASDANRYVQSMTLDGTSYASPWLPWSRVAGGASLGFTLGPTANPAWASDPAAAPPSFDSAVAPPPSPTPSAPACAASMAAPTGVTATGAASGTLQVTWIAPPRDCTGSASYYAVYAYPQQVANPIRVTAGTALTWDRLTPGQLYTFTVTAFDGAGWSAWSGWSAWASA